MFYASASCVNDMGVHAHAERLRCSLTSPSHEIFEEHQVLLHLMLP